MSGNSQEKRGDSIDSNEVAVGEVELRESTDDKFYDRHALHSESNLNGNYDEFDVNRVPSAGMQSYGKYIILGVVIVMAVVVVVVVVLAQASKIPPQERTKYSVSFTRYFTNPILTTTNSQWLYNYNSAFLPIDEWGGIALAVRCQNLSKDPKTTYDVGPSYIAVSRSMGDESGPWTFIKTSDAIIEPDTDDDKIGVEDPRIVKVGTKYYMFYTAVRNTTTGRYSPDLGWSIEARLALATCETNGGKEPYEQSCWVKHGVLFPQYPWSKSGGLLVRDSPPHYLFWGDTSIWIATSTDLMTYSTDKANILLATRSDKFDSKLVESVISDRKGLGPEPLALSNGQYLFLYNSARDCNGEPGCLNNKTYVTGWLTQYNLGYAILSKTAPAHVLYRSEDPILSPELPWETCNLESGKYASALTPNVVFVEGWKRHPTKKDCFIVWYQGCDAYMGVGELCVTMSTT